MELTSNVFRRLGHQRIVRNGTPRLTNLGAAPMADLYRNTSCPACGKRHNLFDTSAVRNAPGGTYRYTCGTTRFEIKVRLLGLPEVVKFLPEDALPMVWVSGWPSWDKG
jgi:hypothetical protein